MPKNEGVLGIVNFRIFGIVSIMTDSKIKLWYLSQINLFRDLPEDILKQVAETSLMRSFEKGRYISHPHDEGERIYFLKEGEVEIYESTNEGKKIIIDILKPGDIFGYESIASESEDERKQFIKANKDVILCIMPKRDFLILLEKRPGLALKLIKDLSARLSVTESRLRDTALSDSETRVLEELERLYKQYGEEKDGQRRLTRKFTHEELANLVGIARETVTRTLARLIDKQKIYIDKNGHIVI